MRYPRADLDGAEPAVRALEANPSVLECHHVAGEDCYILKVAAPSLEALERILRTLREPGLAASTRTTIVLSPCSKSRAWSRWSSTDMAGLRGKALIAYLLVCTVWGSTYLFIRIGVAHLPPFLFAGVRFLVAGLLLGGLVMPLGIRLPSRARDWRTLAITGVFLLCGANAIVVWSEQFIASGIASVLVAVDAALVGVLRRRHARAARRR